ncbi:MAG TPA: hypothetical protein VJZ69_01305 [Clostridia bacterium]|nr:hypothetical protein [Clostridia bacterium]
MDEKIMKTLLKKATGYTFDEVVEEYAVKDDGAVELTRRKVTTKHYPADSSALKAYIELSAETNISKLEDEELQKEKQRLLKILRDEESKKRKDNKTRQSQGVKKTKTETTQSQKAKKTKADITLKSQEKEKINEKCKPE